MRILRQGALRRTGFLWSEACFWHSGGSYALTAPVGGMVQPLAAGGLPENPETKRRLKNILHRSGLIHVLQVTELNTHTRTHVAPEYIARVHCGDYLREFQRMSESGGGELGLRTPFGPGGYDMAVTSVELACEAVKQVCEGSLDNAYALCRPPGHHCTRDFPNGFCLLNNVAVAAEYALGAGFAQRVAILDWDVHHGNGTEAIFYDRSDVYTVSVHQERNYPLDTGDACDVGQGEGKGFNTNVPLPPGAGHKAYLEAFTTVIEPRIRAYNPDLILVSCGFDASGVDPLSRMLCGSQTFRELTGHVLRLADEVCAGRVVMTHEGGYSEAHVPFCGHAVMEVLCGGHFDEAALAGVLQGPVEDPFHHRIMSQQPSERFDEFLRGWVGDLHRELPMPPPM